jgi:fumarate hydratase class II
MHIATAITAHRTLLPSARKLMNAIDSKILEFEGIIKIGRTHTQDATPLTLSQEFSGNRHLIKKGIERIEQSLGDIYENLNCFYCFNRPLCEYLISVCHASI